MRINSRPIVAIGIILVSFVFCSVGMRIANGYAQEGAEEAKAKTAAMMAKMDALGRAESFSSMADRTLSDLQAAAKTPNSNQIIYLARRYERLLEAARFNIFLADRQRKDTREIMGKVEDLSKKGTAVLKKVTPEIPADARSAVERAKATSVKSRSILYQRLVEKTRVPAATPSVPVAPEIPTTPRKVPTVPKVPTIPTAPKAPTAPPQPKVKEPVKAVPTPPPAPPAPTLPPPRTEVSTAPLVPAETAVVTEETVEEAAAPPPEKKKSLWSRWFGK